MERGTEDIDAISRGYEKYGLMVFKIAIKYSADEVTAEDITQEVFLTLMSHIQNIKDEDHLKKWLIVTTKNRAINYIRDDKFDESIEEMTDHSLIRVLGPEHKFVQRDVKQESKELADDILGKLYEKNDRWYDAITMVYYMGKKQKEVAEELGVSSDVLHSVLQRARNWIREKYRERYEKAREE